MKCPACASLDNKVLDSRSVDDDKSIKRRRECLGCGKRFTTYEVIDTVPISVVKKDGSREFFDRHKLQGGLMKACQKRPVDANAIVDAIERELESSLRTEITSGEIGEMVMDRLRMTDEVAYVRFASVYREFKDAATFMQELLAILPEESRASLQNFASNKRERKTKV